MQLNSIFLFISCALLHYSTGQEVTLTECGQTAVALNGTVSYKLGHQYETGELCAFIVRFKLMGFYNFQLESDGINESDPDAISILPLNPGPLNQEIIRLGPPNNVTSANINGMGAVIIFKTTNGNGTGFKLTFNVDTPGDFTYPGMDFIFNNESTSSPVVPFWPPSEEGWSEDVNYILITANSHSLSEPNFLRLIITEDFAENPLCKDYFLVYSYEDWLSPGTEICHDNGHINVFGTTGLFIVIFVKDTMTPSATGTLTWEQVSGLQI